MREKACVKGDDRVQKMNGSEMDDDNTWVKEIRKMNRWLTQRSLKA